MKRLVCWIELYDIKTWREMLRFTEIIRSAVRVPRKNVYTYVGHYMNETSASCTSYGNIVIYIPIGSWRCVRAVKNSN